MWLRVLLVLLIVVQSVLGARLRQAGPHRRRTTFNSPVTSKIGPSYPTQGIGRTADDFELLLRERYENHNFDVDYETNDGTPGADGGHHRWNDKHFSRAYRRGDAELRNLGAQDVGRVWTNTVRSDSGHGGGKLSVDVYSILALGIYTAFKAYLVYHYITTNAEEADNSRSLKPGPDHQTLWKDATRAFERWEGFELLPKELLEDAKEGGSEVSF